MEKTCLTEWIRVSKEHPCPVCGKPDWCGFSDDGKYAICMRIESSRQTRNGGWLHCLSEPIPVLPDKPKKQKQQKFPVEEMTALAIKYKQNAQRPDLLAKELGVSVESLQRLDVGWTGEAWSFPMRDAYERIIGISLRKGRQKFCVGGSRIGLFIPEGISVGVKETLWIVEGATDTAAMLDMGFSTIGRQGCNTCKDLIRDYVKWHDVIIVADNDPAKKDPNTGKVFFPGYDGAMALAQYITPKCKSVRVILPPLKDVRALLNEKGIEKSRAILLTLAKAARYYK